MTASVTSLVTLENNIPLADSRKVAQELGIEHESFFKMITEYQEEIEEDFGLIRFQIGKTTTDKRGRGRPSKYALLTEEQVYAYLAYSQNTPQARACKRKLVKAFMAAREALSVLEIAPNADLTGLSARQIRLVGLAAHMANATEQGEPVDRFILQFIAECEQLTPEERQWFPERKRFLLR